MVCDNQPQKIPYWLLANLLATCLLFYLLFWSGHHYSIDGVVMFQYAKAFLFDQSFSMEPPVRWGDFEFTVSKWAIGMTLAYVPVLAFLSITFFRGDPAIQQIPYAPDTPFNLELLSNRPYQYSSFLNPTVTAMTVVVLFLLAYKLRFTPKQAYLAALTFGLVSPAAVYAKFDFAQTLAAFLLLLGIYLFVLYRQHGTKYLLLSGVCLGLAILTRSEFILVPVPILVLAAYFLDQESEKHTPLKAKVRPLRLMLIGTPILLFSLLHLYVNQARFGSPFSAGYSPASEFTLEIEHFLTALMGNLISPGRGVFIFFPIALFSIYGFRQLLKEDREMATVIGLILAGMLGLYSIWKDWGGGISWGPRFLLPTIPYLSLLGIKGFFSRRWSRKLVRTGIFTALLSLSIVVTLQGLLFDFLDFYARAQIPPYVIVQGDYNFQPQYAPWNTGWYNLLNPGQYDIFWLHGASDGVKNIYYVIMLVILILFFGFLTHAWIRIKQEGL